MHIKLESSLIIQAKFVSPVVGAEINSGVDQGPFGVFAKHMKEDSGERGSASHCWSLRQERHEVPLCPQVQGSEH